MAHPTQHKYMEEAEQLVGLMDGQVWVKNLPGRFLIYSRADGLIGRRTSPKELVLALRGLVPQNKLILLPVEPKRGPTAAGD